jgi:tocopherol O-methyltransferase
MQGGDLAKRDIIDYYDHCQVDYSIVWHLDTHMAMHYGFWDETTPNLRGALVNMNQQVALYGGVQRGDRVLDAGCGVGGSSIFLAKNFKCRTTGISLSEKQVEKCRQNAQEHGVAEQSHFEVADFTNTRFADNSFDVVWGIESVCHAEKKEDFLQEAFRLLKPGGTLIVADFFRNMQRAQGDEKKWLDLWAQSWAVQEFEFHEHFVKKAYNAGFTSVTEKNVTENILPSAKRLYYCFIPGIICDGTLRILGKRNRFHRSNVWSTYYQYKSLKRDYWSYRLIKAVKV